MSPAGAVTRGRSDGRSGGSAAAAEVAGLVWPGALLVLGALTLATTFDAWTASAVLAGAAVGPLVLVRAALLAGVSRWAAAAGAVLLLVLGGYLVTADAGLSLAQVAGDLLPRLLTAPRPYPLRADLVVGPVLLTALVAVLTALRLDGSQRVAPVVGAATLYVAGSLLAVGDADPTGLVAALLVVIAIAGWVLLDQHDEPRRRRLRVAGPVVVVAAALLAGAALVPSTDPADPRDLVDPPLVDVVATSPLSSVGAWNDTPTRPLFAVTGDRVPMRLAVLDRYDGQQWTARPRFAPLGTQPGARADAALPDGAVVRRATTTVRVEGLPPGFVPTPGRPTALALHTGTDTGDADLLTDLETGSVFATPPDGDGGGSEPTDGSTDVASGLTYTVTGVVDSPADAAIAAASVPSGPAVAPYLSLPALPSDLSAYAGAVTQGAVTPYQQAIAIQDEIRDDGTLSSDAISGSSIFRLQSFLLGADATPGARVGSSEQFAAAFALIARANGLPSRVVVGFKPGADAAAAPGSPAGAAGADGAATREVTGADALAWPEVYFDRVGWVPFSPTPDDSTFVRQPAQQVDTTGDPVPPVPPVPTASAVPSAAAPVGRAAPVADATSSWWWWVVGAAALLVLVVLALLGSRVARRRRHGRRGAAGDWAEVLDALHLTARRPPAHASAAQVAAVLDGRMARDAWATGRGPSGLDTGPAGAAATGGPATLLAERADLAAFGPDGHQAGSPADLRVVRRHVRSSLPLWRRWWWWLDPRVFRR